MRHEALRKEEIGREVFRKEEIRREVNRKNFPVHVIGKFFPIRNKISVLKKDNKVVKWENSQCK